jgi:hypothetical protein
VATTPHIPPGLGGRTTTQVTSGLAAGDVVQIPTTTTTGTTGVPGFGGGTRTGTGLGVGR